jgi:hypothetical protein
VEQTEGLVGLAVIEARYGNWSEALRLSREACRIAVAAGNVWGEVSGIEWQARCYSQLGHFKHSIQLVQEGKALIAQGGMQGGDSELRLTHLEGEVYELRTEYAEAQHIHELILQQSSAVLSLSPVHIYN